MVHSHHLPFPSSLLDYLGLFLLMLPLGHLPMSTTAEEGGVQSTLVQFLDDVKPKRRLQ